MILADYFWKIRRTLAIVNCHKLPKDKLLEKYNLTSSNITFCKKETIACALRDATLGFIFRFFISFDVQKQPPEVFSKKRCS